MASTEERFAAALHNTARAWRLALDRRLRHLGMGQASWLAIATIAKAGKPLSQSELADRLGVEAPTMVSMVDRLVKSSYVERHACEDDRRVKHVVLTEEGKAVYAAVRTQANAFRHELLKGVEPAKLDELAALLESLCAAAEGAA